MTTRIIGAFMILSGCGVLGLLMSASYRREIKLLAQFLEFLNTMECELQYKQEALPVMLERITNNRNETVFAVFSALGEELRSQIQPDVQSCLFSAVSKFSNLPNSIINLLEKFGRTLGQYSTQGQLLELEVIRQETLKLKTCLEDEQAVKIRNYRTLSLCIGGVIVIILL